MIQSRYVLLARQALSGAAELKELFGKLDAKDGNPRAPDLSQTMSDVQISLSPQ